MIGSQSFLFRLARSRLAFHKAALGRRADKRAQDDEVRETRQGGNKNQFGSTPLCRRYIDLLPYILLRPAPQYGLTKYLY